MHIIWLSNYLFAYQVSLTISLQHYSSFQFILVPTQQPLLNSGQYPYNVVYGGVPGGVNWGSGHPVAMTTTVPTSSNVQQTVMGTESPNLADEFMKQLQNVNTIGTPRHGNLLLLCFIFSILRIISHEGNVA